jgi:hypothetical protein
MNLIRIVAPLAAAVLAFPAFAQAQKRIDDRQENQENRIKQGEQSGKLTPQEAASLRQGQKHVEDLENKARADGKVTAEEREQIKHAQDEQSRRIRAQNRDANRNAATGGTNPNAATPAVGTGVQSANRENTRRDDREERQENRIRQGEQSGQLTAQEAARLRKGQEHVRDLENKAEYDGKVTAEERAAIERAQDEQSRRIDAQLKDNQRSPATGGTSR